MREFLIKLQITELSERMLRGMTVRMMKKLGYEIPNDVPPGATYAGDGKFIVDESSVSKR
jgi:5-enolpyruvylshikimate-3-phosphate synthase